MSTWGDGVHWDVAADADGIRHVILRHDQVSMCGRLGRQSSPGYVGDHNGGATSNCSLCKHLLKRHRDQREKEMQQPEPDYDLHARLPAGWLLVGPGVIKWPLGEPAPKGKHLKAAEKLSSALLKEP